VLAGILQRHRFKSIDLSDVCLALVGLMWVFPFLHYRHQYPLTTFDQEWWSAFIGVLALTLLVTREFWEQPQIPRIAQLPATLIGVVMVQMLLNKVAYFDQGLLYILYLLFATLLMVLGARLRACFGVERLALVLAWFLLVGAELSALIGVLQHFRWNTVLNPLIAQKVSASVFGNVAQPNHFASYVALGLISLGLLVQFGKLNARAVVPLAIPLLFVMTLSGSRSSWLYMLLMCGLAWWWTKRDVMMRPLLRYGLLLTAGFGLMHLVVQLPFFSAGAASVNTVQRMFGDAASGSIRLYLWHEAWLMFTQAPWLGVGVGQFANHHFQLLPVLRPENISGLYNNAHNLVLQIAAEMGLAGLLALLASLAVWLHGLRQKYAIANQSSSLENMPANAKLGAAHWWGYAALGVLAIHSLLEYPLWYSYFVAIAAILLGAFDETRYRLELRNVGRLSIALILLLGMLSLVQLRSGYQQLKDTLALTTGSGIQAGAQQRVRDGLLAVYQGSLLAPYAELFISSVTQVDADHLKEKLALNTNVMHFIPIAPVVYRQALFLAQDGQLEQAKVVVEQAIWSYPGNQRAHDQLVYLAEKDPAHFSALLEFAVQKEQERVRAIHQQ